MSNSITDLVSFLLVVILLAGLYVTDAGAEDHPVLNKQCQAFTEHVAKEVTKKMMNQMDQEIAILGNNFAEVCARGGFFEVTRQGQTITVYCGPSQEL